MSTDTALGVDIGGSGIVDIGGSGIKAAPVDVSTAATSCPVTVMNDADAAAIAGAAFIACHV